MSTVKGLGEGAPRFTSLVEVEGAFAEVRTSPDTALVDATLVTSLDEAPADAEGLRSISELDVSRLADVALVMLVLKSLNVLV